MDDVTELTRLVTSNMLKVDIDGIWNILMNNFDIFYYEGFHPLEVLTPARPTMQILRLVSDLDGESYPFQLKCDYVGQKQNIMLASTKMLHNKTSKHVSVYVQSSNLHWSQHKESTVVENPFEQNIKLTEIAPGETYHLPLGLTKDANLFLKPKDMK